MPRIGVITPSRPVVGVSLLNISWAKPQLLSIKRRHHMSDIKMLFAASALSMLTVVPAFAASPELVPLAENDAVNNRLVTAGIVRRIHKQCPRISFRKFRSFMYLRGIYNLAQQQGYSADVIEAYIDDEEQEARLYVHVDNWLAQRGALEGNAESYCAIGDAEMTADSQIGNFLRTD